MEIESSSATYVYKQTAFRCDVYFDNDLLLGRRNTRLVVLRVHALHCFFTRTYMWYHAVVGSSEFTPRKQWFISLCRRSLNFFPLFVQKNANIIPISWLIKRLKKKNEVKFLFFCLCECIMSTRFYNTRVVMTILLLLYRNIIVAVCDYIPILYTRYVKKKMKKK